MPSTINGIGTHYYGQKNLQRRPGPCPHCGAAVELTSYDTRLWFVVVFIPLIPLGRKRIIDKCPACTRHFAVEADQWETSKQLEISGAEEKLRASPTPENAIALHQRFVNFHQFAEAAAFRQKASAQFSGSAMLQAHFGDALAHFGKFDEAAPFYARALALRPDLPEARTGVADGYIRTGRLDEARPLLDFLEKPGAAQLYSLAPLEQLALAYQKNNRHEDALVLFARLLEALPQLAEHKVFRAMVKKSEKALGRSESLLPKGKFRWRNLFSRSARSAPSSARSLLIFGVLLALGALGFVIANEYIRRHRTVYLVNGYSEPGLVEISGTGISQKVGRREAVVLMEGPYHARITGPVKQELDFEVRTSYFDRWFDDPAWVLNIGGDAVLLRSEVTYRRDPPPAVFDFHFGRPFEYFAKITHPFQTLPETLQLKSSESRTLVDLQFFDGSGTSLMGYFLTHNEPDRALELAETWLHTHPADDAVLRLYAATAQRRKAGARADAYLGSGLAVRPVRIEWHRAYQGMHDSPAEHDALVAKYTALLAAAPEDSALLYLRGRIDGNQAVTRDLFERSARADARNPYPVFGLAYDRMAAGDWSAAQPLLARVLTLQKKDRFYEYSLTLARFANGEAAAVERETRDQLKREPTNALVAIQLVDALAGQDNRRADILQVCDAFAQAVAKQGANGRDAAASVRRHALYALGDFPALEKAAGGVSPAEKTDRAHALIEQDRLAEAVKALPAPDSDEDQLVEALALAVAWRKAGDETEAGRWLASARKTMAAGNEDAVQAAAWLDQGPPPDATAARDVAITPRLKAILLVAVIAWHPESRAELTPLARRLNVERTFPFHLVQRATAPAL